MMHKTPPIVKNAKTPKQVLGDMYEPFCLWIQQCAGSEKLPKLKESDAARMGACIDMLTENGYVVGHIEYPFYKVDLRGNVIFSQRTMSDTDVARDKIALDSPAEARKEFYHKLRSIGG